MKLHVVSSCTLNIKLALFFGLFVSGVAFATNEIKPDPNLQFRPYLLESGLSVELESEIATLYNIQGYTISEILAEYQRNCENSTELSNCAVKQ